MFRSEINTDSTPCPRALINIKERKLEDMHIITGKLAGMLHAMSPLHAETSKHQ